MGHIVNVYKFSGTHFIYADATKDPFSYLLIDMTQEGKREVKYLSHLFERDSIVYTYIPT